LSATGNLSFLKIGTAVIEALGVIPYLSGWIASDLKKIQNFGFQSVFFPVFFSQKIKPTERRYHHDYQ